MQNYKELLTSVKGIAAAVQADKAVGDKTFEVYRRLAAIVADRHYWAYDKAGEDKTARDELKKLLTDIQKNFTLAEMQDKRWEKQFPGMHYVAKTAPATLVEYVFGETGGTLLIPTEKFYKDAAEADHAKKLSEELPKKMPRALRVIDKGSMSQEDYQECAKSIKALEKDYNEAWALFLVVKGHLEKKEAVPKDVAAKHQKELDDYNKKADAVRKASKGAII